MKSALQSAAATITILACWIVASSIDFQVECAQEIDRHPLIEIRCDPDSLFQWRSCACVYAAEKTPSWALAHPLRRPE